MNWSTPAKLAPLAVKQLVRHRLRTSLTVLGIGAGMFLFTMVETMQQTMAAATRQGASDTTLVVYRENRFCPATSRLPVYYGDEIKRVPGVREVIPIQITVNHCGAGLDIVTFRGVPPRQLPRYAPQIEVVDGSFDGWQQADDGALLGEALARRRGLEPGDVFEAAGVRVRVSGILSSPYPQDNHVAYVHLPFLQQVSRLGLGTVTQFNVRVDDPAQLEKVAGAIDEQFRTSETPTHTQPEKAFFAHAAGELLEQIRFSRWIGLGAVVAVLGLISNAVLLVVRGRVREIAVLQTVGYSGAAVGWLVLLEGMLLGIAGGLLGGAAGMAFLLFRPIAFGSEGQVMAMLPDPVLFVQGIGLAVVLGALAAAYPAWMATQRPIVEALRT